MFISFIMYRTEDFFAVLYESASMFIGIVMNYGVTYFFKIVEYIKNVDYHTLGIRGLVLYSNISSQTYKYCKKVYANYPLVKQLVDRAIYAKDYTLATLENYKIEPYHNNWICTASLKNNTSPLYADDPYTFTDTYDFIFDYDNEVCVINEFNNYSKVLNVLLNQSNNVCEFMAILKYDSCYIYKLINKNYKEKDAMFPPDTSNVKFISIQYTNSKQRKSIFIDLDKSIYKVGNEILSPIFIKRHLSYQSLNVDFDYNYELNIIDGDLNTIVLSSNQYILLNADSYEIINC